MTGPHFLVLVEFKSVSGSFLENNYFTHLNLSFTGEMWRISHCPITIIMESAPTTYFESDRHS